MTRRRVHVRVIASVLGGTDRPVAEQPDPREAGWRRPVTAARLSHTPRPPRCPEPRPTMPIKVTCPKCQGVLHAPDDAGGKRGKCPTCGTVLAIPAEDQ